MDQIGFGVGDKNYFNMPYWIAVEKGFLAQEGIETQAHVFYDAEQNEERLERQIAPVVYHSTENILGRIEKGSSAVIVAGSMHRFPFTLIGRPEIKRVTDLRGKTIGVSSLEGGTSTILRRYFAKHGLIYNVDYDMQPVGMIIKRREMLESGEISAGLQGIPLDKDALDKGFTDLGDYAAGIGVYDFSCMVANREWAAKNRMVLVRLLRAIIRSCRWFYANREGSTEIASKYTDEKRHHLEYAWDKYTGLEIFPCHGELSLPGMRAVLDVSSDVKGLEFRKRKPAEDYVDLSFYQEAIASLDATTLADSRKPGLR